MQATSMQKRGRELRAIVRTIRMGWSEEERERRRQLGEARQKWLMNLLHDVAEPDRAAS